MPSPSLHDLNRATAGAAEETDTLVLRLERAYRPIIAQLMREAALNLRRHTRGAVTAAAEWTRPDMDELMDRLALEARLAEKGDAVRATAMHAVTTHLSRELGISLSLTNPLIRGVLDGQGQKITAISEHLRRQVMTQINEAWEDGLSVYDTAKLLTRLATDFSRTRAEMIARTEIIGTVNQASLAAAQVSGAASHKQWLSTLDSRTRETHAEAHGQTVPLSAAFNVGGAMLNAPGDPYGPAEEVVNCRCTVIYSNSPMGNDLSGIGASGMSDTLAAMTVSIGGTDYLYAPDASRGELAELNPGISDEEIDQLLALPASAATESGESETAAAEPGTAEAVMEDPAASIGEWTADPLIPYGTPTRDGRMIRSGGLTAEPQMPLPLMYMGEDTHGASMVTPPSQLAGAITSLDDSAQRMAISGTFDDSDAGRAAMQATRDGRMGISADLAIEEYEFVMSQDSIDQMNGMMDGGEVPEQGPSQDVEGGVVVEQGDMADMGIFVATRYGLMGATIVPFAAFDESRIELSTLAADGHPTHARIVMPLRLVASSEPPSVGKAYIDVVPRVQDPEDGSRMPLDALPAVEAIIAAQRSAAGIPALEALAAALRADRGEQPRPVIDAEVALALVQAIGEASRDPGLTDLAAALAASASRPQAQQPIIVNPPPVTVHTPDVHVENHQPDVHVTAGGKPRKLIVTRDDHGNAVSYETEEG